MLFVVCFSQAQTSSISRSVNIFGDTVFSYRNNIGQKVAEWSYSRDIFGNKVYTVKDGMGRTVKTAKEDKDIFGNNRLSISDGMGRTVGRMESSTDIFGDVTQKYYGDNLQLLRSVEHKTDIFGHKIITVRDGNGRQLRQLEIRDESADAFSIGNEGKNADLDPSDYAFFPNTIGLDKSNSSAYGSSYSYDFRKDSNMMLERIANIFGTANPVKVKTSGARGITTLGEFSITDQTDRAVCSLRLSVATLGGTVRTLYGEDGKVLFSLKPATSLMGNRSVKLRDRSNKVLMSIALSVDPWNARTAMIISDKGEVMATSDVEKALLNNLGAMQQQRKAEVVKFFLSVLHDALI